MEYFNILILMEIAQWLVVVKAGQVSYPVAVVRFGGKLYQLKLDEIDFCEVKNET